MKLNRRTFFGSLLALPAAIKGLIKAKAPERILVKNQPNPGANGIYDIYWITYGATAPGTRSNANGPIFRYIEVETTASHGKNWNFDSGLAQSGGAAPS